MGDEYKSDMTQRAKVLNRVCCAWKSPEHKSCHETGRECCAPTSFFWLYLIMYIARFPVHVGFWGWSLKGLGYLIWFGSCGLCNRPSCCVPKPGLRILCFSVAAPRPPILKDSWGPDSAPEPQPLSPHLSSFSQPQPVRVSSHWVKQQRVEVKYRDTLGNRDLPSAYKI